MFESIIALFEGWAIFFSDHPTLATAIVSVHVLTMFAGGGMAIGADRAILRAAPGSAEAVRAVLADLATLHSVVIAALAATLLSGAALFTSDLEILSTSKPFWAKMIFIVALLLNGLRLRRVERAVLVPFVGQSVHTTEMPVVFPAQQWRVIRQSAALSMTLWMTIVVLGVVVANG